MSQFSKHEQAQIDNIVQLLSEPSLTPTQRRLCVEMAFLGGRASGREITASSLGDRADECGVITGDAHGFQWECTWRKGHQHPAVDDHCRGRLVSQHKGSAT